MSRPTPFDLIFGDFADDLAAMGTASVGPGADLDLRGFAGIPEVQRLLQRIEVPELVERAPEAASEYLALVYAAARFAAAGKLVLDVSRDRLEPALDQLPPPTTPTVPNHAAPSSSAASTRSGTSVVC